MKPLSSGIITMTGLLSVGIASQKCVPPDDRSKTDETNFIVIFIDDMGYGGIGAFGHPTINTPNLDRMAYEGQKWTQFGFWNRFQSP